jgi:hypothetical protein
MLLNGQIEGLLYFDGPEAETLVASVNRKGIVLLDKR